MNVDTAIEEVRARLQELTPDFWTAPEVLRALNEGQRRFAAEEKWPWLYTSVTNGALAAHTATFALQEGVSVARHFNLLVTFSGDARPRCPRRVSPTEGMKLRAQFYTESAEPFYYFLVSEADADTDGEFITTIQFVPVLTRAATLEYQYIRDPATLVAGGGTMDIPLEYEMGPIAWATGHLFMKELQFSNKAEEQFALYQKVVEDARRESRRLAPDSGFAWGRSEPEPGAAVLDADLWARQHMPELLGP